VPNPNSKRPRGRPPKPPTIDELPDIMTVSHVRRFLQIGERQTYEAIHKGETPAIRIGGQWRVLKRALLAALGDPLATTQVGDGDGSGSDIASLGPQSHDQISRSTTG
jgi:excisionase family DNA binding protein